MLRAPADGVFEPCVRIGDEVHAGTVCGEVAGKAMVATIDGVVRGLLQAGVTVRRGMKSGDVDPRCEAAFIRTTSDKASAVGGGVLEAILHLTGALAGVGSAREWQAVPEVVATAAASGLDLSGIEEFA